MSVTLPACSAPTFSVSRLEAVYPATLSAGQITVGSCTYVVDGTGVVLEDATHSSECATSSGAATTLTFGYSMTHAPVTTGFNTIQVIIHDSKSVCSTEVTLSGMTSDIIPGSKLAVDPNTTNSVLLTYFTHFGNGPTNNNRVTLVVPQGLRVTAPSFTWVYPTGCAALLLPWSMGNPFCKKWEHRRPCSSSPRVP